MAKGKSDRKQGGKKKGQSAKFEKRIEYNAPLKYKTEAESGKKKVMKLTYHVDAQGQIYNAAIENVTESKTVKVNVETFDDGSEEEFLIFKRNFEQTIEDWEMTPQDDAHGAKHLYTALRKSLSGNVLDEWLDTMAARVTLDYNGFKEDLWALTERQIDEDSYREQSKYLESTKKPRSMKSKEWISRLKVINNYLPQMKRGTQKYTELELIEKIVWNTIPEAWQKDFEMFDGPRATTMQQVQTIL